MLCKSMSGKRRKCLWCNEVSTGNGVDLGSRAVSRTCCECAPNISCNQARPTARGKAGPCRSAGRACTACAIAQFDNGADSTHYALKTTNGGLLGRLFLVFPWSTTPDKKKSLITMVPITAPLDGTMVPLRRHS